VTDLFRLDGKVALVTGASRGLGAGIARALADAGADVIVHANATPADATAAAIAESGRRSRALTANLEQDAAAAALAEQALDVFGRVDILVNNAGGSRSFKELHVGEAAWQEAITLNFHRPRQLGDALIDAMIARGWGRIVNITGKSEPEHINGAFCAKAALHSWAKGLSRMVGRHGITVNCVPPGRIHSEQILRNYTPEYRQWQSEHEIPVGRYGEPEDIANLVCFLASPRASYITGAVIPVDGGLRRYQF
jgi:3-oxoacyl-[acyl-carrier protein] reductase